MMDFLQSARVDICRLMYSAWRRARATMVSVGLAEPGEVKALPSEMNRFGTSCVWPWPLATPSLGRALMRAVHMLWVAGVVGLKTTRLAPIASYIVLPCVRAC